MQRVRVTVRGQVQEERDVDRELIVGRKPPADIVIAASEVSSRHARIRPGGASLLVADLGSTNGSTVDGGAKLAVNADTPLAPGQKLRIGPAVIEALAAARPDSSPGF